MKPRNNNTMSNPAHEHDTERAKARLAKISPADKLARVKAWLQERIDEAEKVPAEKWKVCKNPKGTFIRKDDPYSIGVPMDICRLWNSTALANNAAFIASSRTAAPMAYKGLLVAIEGLERNANEQEICSGAFTPCPTPAAHRAIKALTSILNLFPDDL